jgi:RNA polymerase sigma-70 factor (ECF subfamily)
LNISPKTVENHIGAALKQLRTTMMQYLNSVIL